MGDKEKKELVANKDLPMLTRGSVIYIDLAYIRSLILAIPYFGSPIDLILSKKGKKYHQKRIELFLSELKNRLNKVENQILQIQDEEGLFDIMQTAFEQVVKSRSKLKIERFSLLTADYIVNERNWDETEALIKLVGELSDTHIDILNYMVSSPRTMGSHRVVYIGGDRPYQNNIPVLGDHFPKFSESALKMYCSELVSKNLLHDEGIGRANIGSLEYIEPTDLAFWLLDKIKKQNI